MSNSPLLGLPFIEAAQAQKHVTHNEALKALDAVIQLAVLDRDLAAPPGVPAEGDRYIVAAGATGSWLGKDAEIATFQDGVWTFYAPREGWLAWVADEDKLLAWDGTGWSELSGGGGSVNPTPLVGVNATANTTNRLSVSSPASLFSDEGNGHQLKINKNAAADTASSLYQTGFSGRAEMGLTGDDDFHFKVSSDGSAWKEAILISRTSGEVTFPNTPTISQAIVNGRVTLEPGVAVSQSDQTAKTAVLFTPHEGDLVALHDGASLWGLVPFSEQTLLLTDDAQTGNTVNTSTSITDLTDTSQLMVGMEVTGTGIPGSTTISTIDSAASITISNAATASGSGVALTFKVPDATTFDLLGHESGGTLKVTGEITTRTDMTGYVKQNGVWVKSGDSARRLLGTLHTSAAGQCEDSEAKRFVWNMYNREPRSLRKLGTGSHAPGATGWQTWLGSTAYRVEAVFGVPEARAFVAMAGGHASSGTGASALVGIDLDGTTANDATKTMGSNSSSLIVTVAFAEYRGAPGAGKHHFQAMQNPLSTGFTFFGDGGIGPYGLSGEVYG